MSKLGIRLVPPDINKAADFTASAIISHLVWLQ